MSKQEIMKKILILLLIVSSFKLTAQHQDLEQMWYVHGLTVNGVTTEIPNNPINFPYVYLDFWGGPSNLTFSKNQAVTNDCEIGFRCNLSYTLTNAFEFVDYIPQYTDTECSASLIGFMNLYVGFYEDYVTEQFIYSITTEIDNSKRLLVTNNNGDTITYTNAFPSPPPQSIISNNWFLHNLIINGIDNIPPNNINIRLYISEGSDGFSTDVCSGFEGYSPFFDLINSTFYIYESATNYGMSICDPAYPENNTFTDLYIRDFYLNNLPGPFSYEHTIDGDNETLIITNSLGNQAIYKNATLSTQDYDKASFSIFPNPVIDKLTIKELGIGEVEHIWVYNILGKEMISTKQKTVDLQELDAGVYLVKVKLKNKKIVTRKIIKN